MSKLNRLPVVLIWPGLPLLYLLLPGHVLGLLPGLPLDAAGLGMALALLLAAWCGFRPHPHLLKPLGAALVVAAGLKLLLAAVALPYGLNAAYSAAGDPLNAPERSTQWQLHETTRVDRTLDLEGDFFPLHFFNDLRRFNYYTPSQPRRDLLPFAVIWRGWLYEPADQERCYQLQANGPASLQIAGLPVATIQRPTRLETHQICGTVQRGTRALEVRFSRPEGGVPKLLVSRISTDGQALPLPTVDLLRASPDAAVVERDRLLGGLAWWLDLLVLVGCTFAVVLGGWFSWRRAGLWWERPLLSAGLLAAFAEAVAVHRHFLGRTAILSGGNDWLAYESYARDVLLSGLLMTGGKPLGEGETFYYQPLYIYFLAGLHALLGESLGGPLLAQYVLVAGAGVLTYFLARELFGRAAAVTAFGLFWAFRYLVFNQVAGLLLSENLVAVIIPAMLLMLVRWHRTGRHRDLLTGGALLGLAILTRSTPILFLPPAMGLVALASQRRCGRWRPALSAAALLFAAALAVASLVGVRNYLVAGRPALLPESASANLWEAHRPSPKVDLEQADRSPLYRQLGLDRQTREVLEFARQDPLGYSWSLAVQGLYAMGITGPALNRPGLEPRFDLLALSGLYLGGLLVLPAARRRPAWLVHAFIGTHFLQMMVFFAHQYGFRLPMPMYGPMLTVAGLTLVTIGRWAIDRAVPISRPGLDRQGRAEYQAAAVRGLSRAVIAGALLFTGWQVIRERTVEAEVFGLGGDAGPAARAVLSTPESWLANRIYFSGRDGRSLGVSYLPGLAYRDMKWFDQRHAFVWPAEGVQALRIAPDHSGGQSNLGLCWDGSSPVGLRELPRKGDLRLHWLDDEARARCPSVPKRQASFGGLLDLLVVTHEPALQSGPELRVAWSVVQRPTFRAQLLVEGPSPGPDGAAITDPYPSLFWEPGELVVARIPIDGRETSTAVGFTRGRPDTRLAITDPLPLYNQIRISAVE